MVDGDDWLKPLHFEDTTSARAVRELLGIPPDTLRRWAREGLVRKLGRDKFSIADVLALVEHWKRRGGPGRRKISEESDGKHV